jgi:c-di-GMP-binding flagellar brake protein YcgR
MGRKTIAQSPGAPTGLLIWQSVELGVARARELRWYRTRVEEYDPRGRMLVVGWPMEQLSYVSVRPGERVYLGAPIVNDAFYVVECLVVEAALEPVARLTLHLVGEWHRKQRREHVRIELCLVPERACLLVPDGQPEPIPALMLDLSAGGTRLRLDRPLPVGERLQLSFAVPGYAEPITTRAEVRRCQRVEHADPPRWDVGCRFDELGRRETDQIVRFVFARQRELARQLRGEA